MKSNVMLGTCVGPGKAYAVPVIIDTLQVIEGVDHRCFVVDGVDITDEDERLTVDTLIALDNPVEDLNRIQRISRVRSCIREHFLKSKCTHLFFLDADVIPPVDIVERLLKQNAPIATGIYPLRDFAHIHLPSVIKTEAGSVIFGATHATVKSQTFGMGCMLIERDVLKKTEFRHGEGLTTLGEDYGFCMDAGCEVAIDPTISCWHVHSNMIAGRFKVEDAKVGVMWEGSARYGVNKHGKWVRGEARYDLSSEQVAELGPEFSVGQFTPIKVETRSYAEIVA